MSTAVNHIEEIKELLNEEKWTGQSVGNYAKKDFIKLDDVAEKALKGNYATEVLEECRKFLSNSPRSITALYLAGIISLEQGLINDTYIYQVIQQLKDHDKTNLVEFLADKRLDYGEDKPALEILYDVYNSAGNEDGTIEVLKRLARIDFENGEIAKKLGEYYENKDQFDEATHHFKAALRRYVKKGNIQQIENLWKKVAELTPDDLDFFYSIERDLAKKNEEKTAELLGILANYFIENDNNEKAIEILKKIMVYTPKNNDARNQIVECFKSNFSNHSQLEEYIRKTKINQTWKNFSEALQDFEKHIAFDINNWVYHKSWKIGKITGLDEETFTIDFESKTGHNMTLQMALKSLEVLPENHLWIQKRFNMDKLRDDSEEGITFVLETIFKSFNNEASLKEIKREMTDGIIPVKDWNKWWAKAKKILKKGEIFGSSYDKKDHYFLRKKKLPFHEEMFNKFQNLKSFQGRFEVIQDYLKDSEDYENDNFTMMLQYFAEIANDKEHITEKTVQSYLLLRKLERQSGKVKDMKSLRIKPEEIANGISNYTRVFEDLPDAETKKELIELLRKNNSHWEYIISEFLKTKPTRAHNYIMDELYGHGKIEDLKSIVNYITNNYRNNPELFVWTCRYLYSENEIFKATVSDEGSIVYNLIQLIDTLGRDIDNKKEVTLNRKTFNQIMEILFKDNVLQIYLKSIESDAARKCILMIKGSVYLDEKTKLAFLEPFKSQFADVFKEKDIDEGLHHFLVTRQAYTEKQKQLEHILNVEIPKNSKDIGEAQEKGDLRENAEYQSALEKQKNLQVLSKKLDDDIKKAKVIQAKNVDITKVSPGTKLLLKNLDSNSDETFVILGEWDSQPEKNIVSYKSPFGAALLGYKVNEEVEINLAENNKRYKVLSIEIADEVAND